MTQLNWAILGLGAIAEKLASLDAFSNGGRLHCVAARNGTHATEFAAKHKVPLAFGSYKDAISHPQVTAVYISVPTRFKHALTLLAATHKKHVLVEKPIATNASEAAEMLKACRENGVVFLDGTQFAHNLRTLALRNRVDLGELGNVIHCSYDFTNVMPRPNIRYDPKLEPHGALGDLGWYCIRAIDVMMGPDWPKRVWATYDSLEDNAITSMTAQLEYAKGKTARFHCSFREPRRQFLVVSGTKLGLNVEAMVRPRTAPAAPTYQQIDIAGTASDVTVAIPGNEWFQEHAMFEAFARMVKEPGYGQEWNDAAFMTMCVIDAAVKSADEGGVWKQIEMPVFI